MPRPFTPRLLHLNCRKLTIVRLSAGVCLHGHCSLFTCLQLPWYLHHTSQQACGSRQLSAIIPSSCHCHAEKSLAMHHKCHQGKQAATQRSFVCRERSSMAAWGAPDSQRGSADGSRSSMSSHIPSGMAGLPSMLQGTLRLPVAWCISVKAALHNGACKQSFLASRPSGILSNAGLQCVATVQVPQIDNRVCKAFDLHSVLPFA